MSTKSALLRKKAVKRHFKAYKSLLVKEPKLFHWKKRLVIIHPCADEVELLKKIDWEPKSCTSVDGYYFYKNQVCFFEINSPEMWYKGVTLPQMLYSFSWENYRSVKWKRHKFTFFTHCSPITHGVVGESIKIIDNWFEQHPTS